MNNLKPLQIIGALAFGGIVLTALVFFISSVVSLIIGYIQRAPVIVFKRGAWAMLGVALTVGSVLAWILYEKATGQAPTGIKAKLIGRLTVAGLAMMVLLPLLSTLVIGFSLERKSYILCEQAAYPYHLPGMGEKVYTTQTELCMPWEEFRQVYER